MRKATPFIIIGLILLLALGAVGFMLKASKPTVDTNRPTATPAPTFDYSKAALGADPARSKGDAKAAVVVEEFADFECPSCKSFYSILKEVEKTDGAKFRLIFRQFPLTQLHQRAYDAARASEAAGEQGKFFEMVDLLYANQEEWAKNSLDHRKSFADYARSLGLDVERFKNDMLGQGVSARVDQDLRRGKSLNVTGTPTLYVNGRKLDYATEMTSVNALRQAILSEAAKNGGAATGDASNISPTANANSNAAPANAVKPANAK